MTRRNHHSRQKRRPRAARSFSSRCSSKRLGAASGRTQTIKDGVKSERCSSHRIGNQIPVSAPLVHTSGGACTPFPLAVYRPASLMTMLLVASLLPKNTFSLRWLVLSGDGGRQLFQRQTNHAIQSPSWLAMAVDPETSCMGECNKEQNTESSTRKVANALWNEVI